ncbi:MAG: hypothetical protein AB7F89_03810 [Pirellulaceae bacterium]
MEHGEALVSTLRSLAITDVVWLPDATTGRWESTLAAAVGLRLRRVCREGEAWALAAGLWLGGRQPVLLIQNTGLFESGDALRNVLYDLQIPLYALVGYRNWEVPDSTDSARRFTEPILRAWALNYRLLDGPAPWEQFAAHFRSCREAGCPGVALIPEGRG